MALSMSEMTGDMGNQDRWDREIELQKVYQLSSSEATMMSAKELGLSPKEIAEREGLNVQTVKNTLSNARKKLNREGNMEYYIIKSSTANERAVREWNISLVIANLCKRMGMTVKFRPHLIIIKNIPRSQSGNFKWFSANVERYVDMIGTRTERSAEERAERLYGKYIEKMTEQNVEEPMFGHSVIKYYLDRYAITYDVDETEE